MEKYVVLGTGSWGSALGLTLAKKGYEVSMWTLNEEQAKRINKTRENIDYLPGVLFPNNMTVTILSIRLLFELQSITINKLLRFHFIQ